MEIAEERKGTEKGEKRAVRDREKRKGGGGREMKEDGRKWVCARSELAGAEASWPAQPSLPPPPPSKQSQPGSQSRRSQPPEPSFHNATNHSPNPSPRSSHPTSPPTFIHASFFHFSALLPLPQLPPGFFSSKPCRREENEVGGRRSRSVPSASLRVRRPSAATRAEAHLSVIASRSCRRKTSRVSAASGLKAAKI